VATVAMDTVVVVTTAVDVAATGCAGDCAMAAIDVIIRVCIAGPLDIPDTGRLTTVNG